MKDELEFINTAKDALSRHEAFANAELKIIGGAPTAPVLQVTLADGRVYTLTAREAEVGRSVSSG